MNCQCHTCGLRKPVKGNFSAIERTVPRATCNSCKKKQESIKLGKKQCLHCDKFFTPESKFNRICYTCKTHDKFKDGDNDAFQVIR